MSDLSWLNPTPHAIAVYASSPLSPAATQHSLPSGRYPLLGPDFHRLDRTSLRLAHSLDHLVGTSEKHRRNFDAECLSSFEVYNQLEAGRLLDGQFGGRDTLDYLVHVDGGASTQMGNTHSVGDETSCIYKLAEPIHRRQSVSHRKLNEPLSIPNGQRVNHHDERLRTLRNYGCEGAVKLIGDAYRLRLEHNP